MITILQLVAGIFIVFVASRTILRAKDGKITVGETLFWMTVWGSFLFVVFFPGITTKIANIIGIGRGIDIIIYVSIALLFYLVFRIYIKLEETDRNLTKVVREIAIQGKKKK